MKEKKKKAGRKPSENPKNQLVQVRVTVRELIELKKQAQNTQAGTVAGLIREKLIYPGASDVWTEGKENEKKPE